MAAVVLLVDSDEDTRVVLRAAFEHRGYAVLEAPDGETGLQLSRTHEPDVIVGDFPMDVPEHSPFTKDARAAGQNTPLIVSFSARALPDEVARAEAVADLVITKPANPLEFVDRIEALVAAGG